MQRIKNKLPVVMFALGMSIFFVLSLVGVFAPRQASAATDSTVNFQARLMTSAGAIAPDGNYNVEFKLYNVSTSSGSTQGSCTGDPACLWTETRTSSNKVHIANGYLSVELGSVTAFPNINWDQTLYLTMNIGGTSTSASWDGEMSPRIHLTAVPYAFRAGQLVTNNGTYSNSLSFASPSANQSITLPDASGTVCLQSSTACGFAASSGSGNYIQNTTSVQAANINIQNAASTSSDTATFNFSSGQTGDALKVLSSSGSVVWEVQPSIVNQTVPLRLNPSSLTTFLTPGGASVPTAVNIPLMNPGAFGQILAFGLPSTAATSSRAISIFDARTSSSVQPAISLFSPNENDAFGLTWNGSNTIASLETLSGNIALRPGGTNTQLYAVATGGVGIGTNFSSPNYPLDVAGDINTSTQYRIAGTVICTSGGCTPASGSNNYIQNGTGLQSANLNVQAAGSGSVAAVLQANATGTGDILDLKNGSSTTVVSVSSTGSLALQSNSTTALKLQNTSNAYALAVDTTNSRVAVGQASAAYTLDVAGDINTSTVLRIGGTTVCDSTGCTAKTGSGFYIHNQTTTQSANLNIQAATSGSVAATLQANASGTGDILDLKNGSGVNVATFGSTGAVALQNSTNSTNAFQVENAAGSQLLNVDTANSNVSVNANGSPLGPWHTTTSMPQSLEYNSSASANGFVYSVGGTDGGNKSSVYFAQQNSDGSLASWQSGTSLPVALSATAVVISSNYIYVIGGEGNSGTVATVYYATINVSTGAVGAWTTSGNPIPAALGWGSATVANGYLYFAGGYNGTTNVSTVYYSALNAATGAVGAWTTSGNVLPTTRDSGSLVALNNYLYYTGGLTASGTAVTNAYYAPINGGTGAISSAWNSGTSLPAARSYHGAVTANGYVYVVGGADNSSTQYTVYYAKQGTSGVLGAWNSGTSLPAAEEGAGVSLSANGYIYVMGGSNGDNVSATYYAPTQNIVSVGGDLTASGSLTIQSNNNSVDALQVQNSTGWQLFNVNSSDNVISLNTNSPMNGASSQWTAASTLPASYDGASSVTVNGNVYYIGGYDGTNYVTDVYYAQSSGDGGLGSWKTANSLPSGRAFSSAVTLNGYIYVMGGNASGIYSSTVYYAKVSADGSLGSWQTTASLTGARAYGAGIAANGYIYFLGGRSNGTTYQSTVYYAAPNTITGAISSWTTAANPIPATRALETAVTANGYVYVLGGTSDGTNYNTTVYYAALNAGTGALGSWATSANSLMTASGDATATVSGGYAYIFGGYNGNNVVNSVMYAALNSDGTTGAWQAMGKALPENVNFGASTSANGHLYVLGGYNGSYFLDSVYAASTQGLVAVNSSIGVVGSASFQSNGNSQTAFQVQNAAGDALLNVDTVKNVITLNGGTAGALSAWQQTSSLSAGTSYGGYTIANGYAYVIGGYGTGYISTVQYAPINADGTMGAWSTTTTLPGARGYTAAASAGGFVYVVGGYDGSVNQNTVYAAKQNADGTLGAWVATSTLPGALNAMSVTTANGYLYVLGGTNGGTVTTVSYAHINGDGSLNPFVSGTALPTALANASVVTANGYIYYIGGYNGTAAVATVYYSALSLNGGNGGWTSTSALPATASNFSATVANGNVYVFRNGTTVYHAPFNADGTLGAWGADANSLPVSLSGVSALSYDGYMYILGGYNGAGTTGVYYSSGARTMVEGTLDLVGINTSASMTGDASQSSGGVGGALIAGNTTVVGTLQVQGQSSFNQSVSINGNSLTVGNDNDDPTTGSTLITVRSKGYAGLQLYGDTSNAAGEAGGAFVQFGTDSATQLGGTTAFIGISQVDANSPLGNPYTGVLNNALVLGTNTNVGALQLGTNLTTRLTITTAGRVCIAITSCTHTLGVTGTIAASSTITASGTPDIAETIPTAADVAAADVVMADPNNTERAIKSSSAYESAVLGVISDGTSSFLINAHGNDESAPLTGQPLVLAGRVPVKITDEGGAVKPGDYLTSSSTPGYAMKATHAGPTIGKALDYFDGDQGTVLVLVNVSYYDPTGGLQGVSGDYHDLNVSGDATLNNLNVTNVKVSGDTILYGALTVKGLTSVQAISINGHIVTAGDAPQIQLETAAGASATASLTGDDTAGVVEVTAGDSPSSDDLLKVLFSKSFAQAPRIVITPVGKDSAKLNAYVDQTDNNGFMIGSVTVPQKGTVYTYNYHVLQ